MTVLAESPAASSDLSDNDRGVYETLALRVAQHPSESNEYLIARVLVSPGDSVLVRYGDGPKGLMAAEVLAAGGAAVTVVERMAAPARKFLLAGKGGLNLTHSEDFDAFAARFGAARARVEPWLHAFGPDEVRAWAAGLGMAGSSLFVVLNALRLK